MKDKPVVSYFAAGLLTAAVLLGIYVWIWGPVGFHGQVGFHVDQYVQTSGDDDQVVVAGGSLHIQSRYGFVKDSSNNQQANHIHTKRRNVGVVVENPTQNPPLPGGPVKIEIAYCPNTCGTVPDDLVTLETKGFNGQKLVVHNSSASNPIGVEAGTGTMDLDHQPNNWTANWIKVNGNRYDCVKGSVCKVTLHYYCKSSGTDDCK